LQRETSIGGDIYFYLRTAPGSNFIGLFFMPEEYVAADTRFSLQEVRRHFKLLTTRDLIHYDQKIRYVFLPKMAEEEIGASLLPKDNRCASIQKLYDSLPTSYLNDLFFDRYGAAFNLKAREDYRSTPTYTQITSDQEPQQEIICPKSVLDEKTEDEEALLLSRYSAEQRREIVEVRKHLASTRANGKLARSVWIKILKAWELLSVEQVMHGIEIYLDRGYALDGKKERYLFAIMKNASEADVARTRQKRNPSGFSTVTQHNLLAMEEAKRRLNGK